MRRIEEAKRERGSVGKHELPLNPVYPAHPCSMVFLVPFKPKVRSPGLLVMDFKKPALLNRMTTLVAHHIQLDEPL